MLPLRPSCLVHRDLTHLAAFRRAVGDTFLNDGQRTSNAQLPTVPIDVGRPEGAELASSCRLHKGS